MSKSETRNANTALMLTLNTVEGTADGALESNNLKFTRQQLCYMSSVQGVNRKVIGEYTQDLYEDLAVGKRLDVTSNQAVHRLFTTLLGQPGIRPCLCACLCVLAEGGVGGPSLGRDICGGGEGIPLHAHFLFQGVAPLVEVCVRGTECLTFAVAHVVVGAPAPGLLALHDLGRLLRVRFMGMGGDLAATAAPETPDDFAVAEAARKPYVVQSEF